MTVHHIVVAHRKLDRRRLEQLREAKDADPGRWRYRLIRGLRGKSNVSIAFEGGGFSSSKRKRSTSNLVLIA